MLFIFDNLTDPIDFATVIMIAFESPNTHKFIFVGKTQNFYETLIKKNKIKSFLATYYPNLEEDFSNELGDRITFSENLETLISKLKKEGYDLIGTTPHKTQSKNIFESKFHNKSAFVFGPETGLSREKLKLLDRLVHYPLKKAKFLKIRHILPLVHGRVGHLK